MKGTMMTHRLSRAAFAAASFAALAGAASAQQAASVTIRNHRFEPAEVHVPANAEVTLTVRNLDATPEEFESKHLRLEKIIPGNGTATFRIRALSAGRYRFFGEFHEDTAEGYLVAE